MSTIRPHLEVLPPAQQRLWPELASVPPDCVLYGGTALALRVGGRRSEDFDFFTNGAIDAYDLSTRLPFLRGAEIIQVAPATATFLADRGGTVKISFFGGLAIGRVGDPDVTDDTGVRVASLLDLAAQKVRVVQVRAERKDYLDIEALLARGVSLSKAIGAAGALYPGFATLPTLKALSYFDDGDLTDLPLGTRTALAKAAAAVLEIEPVVLKSPRLAD